MSDEFRPRVLVVENEPDQRRRYQILLDLWHFQPVVVEAQDTALLECAPKLLHEHRCHLALVDMRLLDDNDPLDFSGLDLISQLKPALCIVVSGYPDYLAVRHGLGEKGAFTFIGKHEDPELLREALDKAALAMCSELRGLRLVPRNFSTRWVRRFFPEDEKIPENEISDVLGCLYPNANRLRIEIIGKSDKNSLSRVPRPRSRILRVRADDLQPDVVKIARKEKIAQEVARYQEHIEGRLVGFFNPPLKRWEALWDLGGAVYLDTTAGDAPLFSTFYNQAAMETLEASLRHFFDGTWSDLYARSRARPTRKENLFEAYCAVWETNWYQRVLNSRRVFPEKVMPPEFGRLGMRDPIAWLVEHVQQGKDLPLTRKAITHGDLHGDNMLLDRDNHIWVIDFERSGWGPVLQDFVELESDVLVRLSGITEYDFNAVYLLGVWTAQPSSIPETPPFFPPGASSRVARALRTIHILRHLAFDCTGETDARPYLWGVLLNVIFRATLPDARHTRRQRRLQWLMLASILCHRLDHWNEIWPPASWPSAY